MNRLLSHLKLNQTDPLLQKKYQELKQHFQGARRFLDKTAITRANETHRLKTLPWYVLLGMPTAGKTSLLAHAGIHYILQPRNPLKHQSPNNKQCDFWITPEACLIDVPSPYLFSMRSQKNSFLLWPYFLKLLRQYRGKNGLNGILIALPLADFLHEKKMARFNFFLSQLSQQLKEISAYFHYSIPCEILLTRCDLIPGFKEFFAELGSDEITQAWGFPINQQESLVNNVNKQFDALIKKLNQQLIWRLHQERNLAERPLIKDFPLQIEYIKELTQIALKKLRCHDLSLQVQGIYLCSALQTEPDPQNAHTFATEDHTSLNEIQLFTPPTTTSRAYFLKQLMHHLFPSRSSFSLVNKKQYRLKKYLVYGLSLLCISSTAIILGRDFEHGVERVYAIQNHIHQYRQQIPLSTQISERLHRTIVLLNTLEHSAQYGDFKHGLIAPLSFYSKKSQEKASATYQKALHAVLLPELAYFFSDFLTNPQNKNADDLYLGLKAYVMLAQPAQLNNSFLQAVITRLLGNVLSVEDKTDLRRHLERSLESNSQPIILDQARLTATQKYFLTMPDLTLSYLILRNMNKNFESTTINLGTASQFPLVLKNQKNIAEIPYLFTGNALAEVSETGMVNAVNEALSGNWVLGKRTSSTQLSQERIRTLKEQLQATYLHHYIAVWELLVKEISLVSAHDLAAIDKIIIRLVSHDSPLLQLLQTLRENTAFEPILSGSSTLQKLNTLLDKNEHNENTLAQLFTSLESLHEYIQPVLNAADANHAAFDLVTARMKNNGTLDPITALRVVAMKSPEPLKTWLDLLSNQIWHQLMNTSMNYLNTAWENEVLPVYQQKIANRYPFSPNATQEVSLTDFTQFFGKSGVMLSFYDRYLSAFIDHSLAEWHFKTLDHYPQPFNKDILRQIQHAMRIHQAFFPAGDNQLAIQFSLQPYQFSKAITRVDLRLNHVQFSDSSEKVKKSREDHKHAISWPSKQDHIALSSATLFFDHNKTLVRQFKGQWGWFKMIHESFDSVINKKQMLVNLSSNEHSAKYLLLSEGTLNPFISLDLKHFQLSPNLIQKE